MRIFLFSIEYLFKTFSQDIVFQISKTFLNSFAPKILWLTGHLLAEHLSGTKKLNKVLNKLRSVK